MVRVLAISLLLAISAPSIAAPKVALASLSSTDQVRSETDAKAIAVRSIGAKAGPSYQLYGVVLELSRAHRNMGEIKRGDLVWLISVINAGASDLTPVPEDLIWVRAKDGAVVHLGA